MKGGKEKGNRGEGKGGERRVEGGERVGGGREMTCRREVPLRAVGVLQRSHLKCFTLFHSVYVYLSLPASVICPLGLLCVHPNTHTCTLTHTSPHPSSALLREALKDSGRQKHLYI